MTILIGQIVGCLLVAAGIGGLIGWLLRHLSVHHITQQFREVTTNLRLKGEMLEKAQHELKVRAASISMLERKVMESDTLDQTSRQEISAQQDRLQALQHELDVRTQRLTALEANEASVRRRAHEFDAAAAIQAEEVRQFDLVRREAQDVFESQAQERRNLQRRVAELEVTVAEIDQLHLRVEELEPAQGRVHWLEVQLCDRDIEHRAALHQLEDQLADRAQRIDELERFQPQLKEQEAALIQREATYIHTIAQHEAQVAKLHTQLEALNKLRDQLLLDERLLHERDERIEGLRHQIQDLETQQRRLADRANLVEERETEISRLRKRLVEVRAALRIKTNGATGAPRTTRQNGSQLSLHMEQTNAARAQQKDDLSKIHGIGPVFARTLNKMGMYTFIQIARWKPEDIAKIAKKLYTAPERIKRDRWIDEAKKEHYRKYGERL